MTIRIIDPIIIASIQETDSPWWELSFNNSLNMGRQKAMQMSGYWGNTTRK